MSGWLARGTDIDALAAELAGTRTELAGTRTDLAATQAELAELHRAAALTAERDGRHQTLDLFAERLLGLRGYAVDQAARLSGIEATLAALDARVAALETLAADDPDDAVLSPAAAAKRIGAQDERVAAALSTLASLERRMRLQEAEHGRVVAMLAQRLDALAGPQ